MRSRPVKSLERGSFDSARKGNAQDSDLGESSFRTAATSALADQLRRQSRDRQNEVWSDAEVEATVLGRIFE